MIRFFDYYKDTFRFALSNLVYRMIPDDVTVNLILTDNVQVEKIDTGLEVYYSRQLRINPETEPVLLVVYKVLFDCNEKMDDSSLTTEEIHAALYDNALKALDQVAARMSLLAAEMTFAGYGQPLILPPNVIRE